MATTSKPFDEVFHKVNKWCELAYEREELESEIVVDGPTHRLEVRQSKEHEGTNTEEVHHGPTAKDRLVLIETQIQKLEPKGSDCNKYYSICISQILPKLLEERRVLVMLRHSNAELFRKVYGRTGSKLSQKSAADDDVKAIEAVDDKITELNNLLNSLESKASEGGVIGEQLRQKRHDAAPKVKKKIPILEPMVIEITTTNPVR